MREEHNSVVLNLDRDELRRRIKNNSKIHLSNNNQTYKSFDSKSWVPCFSMTMLWICGKGAIRWQESHNWGKLRFTWGTWLQQLNIQWSQTGAGLAPSLWVFPVSVTLCAPCETPLSIHYPAWYMPSLSYGEPSADCALFSSMQWGFGSDTWPCIVGDQT